AAVTLLLPCLSRIERDVQRGVAQTVSMEDSTACFHGSHGVSEPASDRLLSEPAIVAGLAEATLAPNPKVPWREWAGDYSLIRDAIEATYPDIFRDFNARLGTPGGFPKPLAARERQWDTESGKAEF